MGHLHPELMAPAQALPLFDGNSQYDTDMVHEYLAASLESTRRLIALLPDTDLSFEDAEELPDGVTGNEGESVGADDDGSQLTLFQGPNDFPPITARTSFSIFDE
jgi:hypothetical protein